MKYNRIRQIGKEGGFGQVFECEDEYGNKYALKVLKNNSEFGIQRFEREVRLLSRLNLAKPAVSPNCIGFCRKV